MKMTERHKYWVNEISAWLVIAFLIGMVLSCCTGCGVGAEDEEEDGRKTTQPVEGRPR